MSFGATERSDNPDRARGHLRLAPLLASLALASVALLPARATAQVKPKIYVLFDTSGSMLQNSSGTWQDGDGSALCSNRGRSSRIYQLKQALFDVLQGIGATEVDFALATFPMFVGPTRTPYCAFGPGVTATPCTAPPSCSGHYYTSSSTLSENHPANQDRYGCKISTHAPATQRTATCKTTSCPWYNGYKSQVLKVPFGSAPEQIMRYFDQQEDTGPVASLTNPEVRAGNGWYTPLGKSLFYAYGYFHREVVLPASDYRKKCERLAIAFFTDGAETCNDSSSDAFYPTKWATNLNRDLGVVVNTVAIDTSAGLLSQIASSGRGRYFNVSGNANALKQAFLQIIANALPPAETCNGQDDDCDNKIDEDFPQKGKPCNNGQLGACFRTGTYVCKSDGTGVQCTAGLVLGRAEICDGIDNDCDGQIDEGLPNCKPCAPQPEVCDGKDNNCNGQIDDGVPSGACGTNIGECKAGTLKCVNGKSTCDGAVGPKTEVCNNKDDDCDGQVDGILRGCYPFTDNGCDPKTGVCKGQCRLGQENCTAGKWGQCSGAVGASKEICDGVDNNCDGQVDEQAECPGGSQCVEGECTQPCTSGEFVCKKGQVCKNGWCVLDKCDRAACAAKGWICVSGECIDPCKGVSCNANETCVKGQCVDQTCYNPANKCPSSERCIAGKCAKDPCSGVQCAVNEFCKDGSCVQLCDQVSCPAGQSCQPVDAGAAGLRTECVPDACADVVCVPGQACKDGRCVRDACLAVACPSGQVCVDGNCVKDTCETVTCPRAYRCVSGNCVLAGDRKTKEVLATGAGGVACNVASRGASSSGLGGAPWGLLLLGALWLSSRRRRRRRQGRQRRPGGREGAERRQRHETAG